ncbi:hypothetical protein MPTK1_3g09960 [Marchantia polymorpha subsp. ruderalis]|nr:hypothetical protein MARPO_0085s0031 [Marchantia polymorpha]|eukprot:PTQ33810.1 hypothetical protein MARPO_0085s0031 [Marchantia polymorpha]
MEDFASILVRDYGLKPQGKSAPMSSTKVSPGVGSSRASGYGSERKSGSGRMSGNASTFGGQDDVPYVTRKNGNTKSSGRSTYGGDDLFSPGNYDDVFGGPPKSSSAGPRYDGVFGEAQEAARAPVYDDLFGGLGVNESKGKLSSPSGLSPRAVSPRRTPFAASEPAGFDELLPGFSSEPAKARSSGDAKASTDGDPFVPPLIDDPLSSAPSNSSSAPFIDPMDVFTVPPTMPPINTSTDGPRVSSNTSGAFDGFDIFDSFPAQSSVDASKPRESSQSSRDDLKKTVEDLNSEYSTGIREQSPTEEPEPLERDLPTVETSEAYNISSKSSPFFSFKSDDGMDTPVAPGSSSKPADDSQAGLFASPLDSPVPYKSRSRSSPFGEVKERWLTVNDVKLVTKPSQVPPPSRPPPIPGSGRYGSASRPRVDHMESVGQDDRFVSWPSANSTASVTYANSSEEEQTGGATPGGSRKDFFGKVDYKTNPGSNAGDDEKDGDEDLAAAAKLREKERQEAEDIRIARERKKEIRDAEAREEREKERARRYKEKEREREKDRAAVQRVTLEARERAAQDARDRAQRSAVERATQEARERAAHQAQIRAEKERAAVERANKEARDRAEQRAAVEKAQRDRAEQKAAVERAAAEARERAEKIAVERAQAEARERAEKAAAEKAAERAAERQRESERREAAEKARERSQQQQQQQQRKGSEHDLDAFFNPGLRATPPFSEPKQKTSSMNSNSDNGVRRPTNNPRPSVPPEDYLSSLFNDPSPNSQSTEDPSRGKPRNGAHERSQQRAAKAIYEIKQREQEMQREQAEKHRAADQLDAEIRRWAAGKEGNLRALLSTLQYVLWPECGWQPVSLSDLITAASVKKTYRKATLHVHPDKVQQKGATVQQKYIAEKVFDLLKEASNKFNSEELF